MNFSSKISLLFLTGFDLKNLDLKEIIELDHDHFPRPWVKESWLQITEKPELYALSLLMLEDGLGGFVLYRALPNDDLAHLLKVITLPRLRRSGFGQRILELSFKELILRGYERVYLEVDSSNQEAIGLYNKLGFSIIRELKDYYGAGRNGFSMELHLISN